jgi:hypothetical protein
MCGVAIKGGLMCGIAIRGGLMCGVAIRGGLMCGAIRSLYKLKISSVSSVCWERGNIQCSTISNAQPIGQQRRMLATGKCLILKHAKAQRMAEALKGGAPHESTKTPIAVPDDFRKSAVTSIRLHDETCYEKVKVVSDSLIARAGESRTLVMVQISFERKKLR